MSLILPSRYTQQPQIAEAVDPYWISRGLRFAILPSVGLVNLATNARQLQSTGFSVEAMPSGIAYNGNQRAEFAANLPSAAGVTLISVWRSRASSQYLSEDSGRILLSNRTSGNAGWGWGRNSAVGGGAGGNLTAQTFVINGVAQYTEATYAIESLVDTPVACRYSKTAGLVSWFRFGRKSSTDTTASTSPTTGSNVVFGAGGDYTVPNSPWIDRASIVLGFVGELSDAEIYALTNSVPSVWQVFKAPARNFSVALPSGGSPYSILVDAAGYALSTSSTALLAQRSVSASTSSFLITPESVGLQKGDDLVADVATIAVTATDAVLLTTRKLAAGVATISANTASTDLLHGFTATTGAVSFSIAANDASTQVARVLPANVSNCNVSAQAATLTKTTANSMAATVASFTLTAQSSNLGASRVLSATQQTMSITGVPATLTQAGAGARTLIADSCGFLVVASTANCIAQRTLQPTVATFSVTPESVSVVIGKKLSVGTASVVVTQEVVLLPVTRLLQVASSVLSVSANSTNLTLSTGYVASSLRQNTVKRDGRVSTIPRDSRVAYAA